MNMVDLDSYKNVLFCYTLPESPEDMKVTVSGHAIFIANAVAEVLINLDECEVNAVCNIVNEHWAKNGADDKERVDRSLLTGKGVVECVGTYQIERLKDAEEECERLKTQNESLKMALDALLSKENGNGTGNETT